MSERDIRAEMAAVRAAIEDGDVEPVPPTVGPFAPTGQSGALRWVALGAAAAVGAVLFGLLGGDPLRAALCYLAGLLGAVGAFELGALNIRVVDRYYPHLTLVAAMASYMLTALAMALVLAASRPDVVDAAALAVGLIGGVTVWLGGLVVASRVRLEQPAGPDNISAQHGRNIESPRFGTR